MLRALFLGCMCSASLALHAQIPYRLTARTDLSVYSLNAALGGFQYLRPAVAPYTAAELSSLQVPNMPSWEAVALNRWDPAAGRRSDLGLFAAFGAAGLTALAHSYSEGHPVRDGAVLGSMWFQANLSSLMLTEVVKNSVQRNRPFAYNDQAPLAERLDADVRKSFFSGHSSITACNAVFAAKIWSDMHPNSRYKPLVWTAAAVVPAYVAAQRVRAGKHYPSDVLVGLAVGAAVGYIIPQIHLSR